MLWMIIWINFSRESYLVLIQLELIPLVPRRQPEKNSPNSQLYFTPISIVCIPVSHLRHRDHVIWYEIDERGQNR